MLYNILYCCQCSTCFERFSAYHQELKNSTCSIGYLSNLFAATANVGESETSIRCYMYSFWAPDDERKKRSKHVEHWQQYRILYNVASCWLCLRINITSTSWDPQDLYRDRFTLPARPCSLRHCVLSSRKSYIFYCKLIFPLQWTVSVYLLYFLW
jgi:hypothetical protein